MKVQCYTSAEPGAVLPDSYVQFLATRGMISPWMDGRHRPGRINYGTVNYGYDARIGEEFVLFAEWCAAKFLDPKDLEPLDAGERLEPTIEKVATEDGSHSMEVRWVGVPPHGMVLGHTVESFDIPTDVIGLVHGKPEYTRCGLLVSCAPLEPGFRGQAPLALVNPTASTIKVYANEGIAQVQFHVGYRECRTSYNDRGATHMEDS